MKASTTGELYAAFMQEIKQRIGKVERIIVEVAHRPEGEEASYLVELAHLQIRFICELTALASLAAHNSYGIRKDLLKKWHADIIFDELERINPHSFPVPVRATVGPDGVYQFQPAKERRLSRAHLKQIYGNCGRLLHRGVLKHTLQGRERTYDLNQVAAWLKQLYGLLAEHMILLPKEQQVLMVNLIDGEGGRVQVAKAVSDGPFAVSPDFRLGHKDP
ncbi:hypothetical protein LVY65_01115 [Sphingomonas sp. G124]|uniref:Uncharacterized protein n=1 Tax=Sphingomonas cremea TaxID=2904799 RepID=A0A9X1TX12_9SPHN|nr:hypothetical protein [Sphingomonas cremea]MCF2513668.1 hypothetical protein [Sphingomonas cremea]